MSEQDKKWVQSNISALENLIQSAGDDPILAPQLKSRVKANQTELMLLDWVEDKENHRLVLGEYTGEYRLTVYKDELILQVNPASQDIFPNSMVVDQDEIRISVQRNWKDGKFCRE